MTEVAKKAFFEYKDSILPARSISVSVMNYKTLD